MDLLIKKINMAAAYIALKKRMYDKNERTQNSKWGAQ